MANVTPVRREVRIGLDSYFVWMVADFDSYLNSFAEDVSNGERGEKACPFGALLWPSSRALLNYFGIGKPGPLKQFNVPLAIELGCGVGMLSCFLPLFGIESVIATDFEPDLQPLIALNARDFAVSDLIKFEKLDWTKPLSIEKTGIYPLVFACDVLYDDTHISSLPKIASELLTADGVLYIADPERFRYESALEQIKSHFKNVKIIEIDVENDKSDAAFGLVRKDAKYTRVKILECRKTA